MGGVNLPVDYSVSDADLPVDNPVDAKNLSENSPFEDNPSEVAKVDEAGPTADSPKNEEDDLPELEIVCGPGNDLPVTENEPGMEKEAEQEIDHSTDSRAAEHAEPDGMDVPRCSERHRVPPERLQYTRLGGPLISIV